MTMMRSTKMRAGVISLLATLIANVNVAAAAPAACISRDVVVVGGGAAGAHAAVWLRDHGKSVIVVEKAPQLGGHTAVYKDPVSGKVINVGVQAWMEYKNTFDFPARMNVSTSGSMEFAPNTAKFIDFRTGKPASGYAAPQPAEMYPAIQKFLDALTPYENMVLPGFFNFPAPASIPEDLLMPFGQFVKKYGLEAAVPQIWDATAQGLGDTMSLPTLFVIQGSGVVMARALLGAAAAAVPASGRLMDLFDSIANFLGKDVLYSSTVVASRRTAKGVQVQVRGANGKETQITAKRLLIAFEPTTENTKPFDMDAAEKAVFNTFDYTTVYAGVLRHPSLEFATAYTNRLPTSGNWTEFPIPSQVGRIDHIGGTQDLFQFTAVGTDTDTPASMKALIAKTIDTMVAAGTIPKANGTTTSRLTFPAFANHGLMHPRVTAADLKAGFVQKQLALQGRRSTWYTGAAFSAGFSTVLWEYNNVLLPSMIAGM